MNFGGGMRRINGDQTTRVLPRCGKESRNGGIVDDFLSPKSWFSDSNLIRFSEIVYYWKATSWCISCRWMPIHDFPNIITWHYFVKTNHGPCFFFVLEMMGKVSDRIIGSHWDCQIVSENTVDSVVCMEHFVSGNWRCDRDSFQKTF